MKVKTRKRSAKPVARRNSKLNILRKGIATDAHLIPLDELCISLDTDPATGLTPEQAKFLLAKNGPNLLTPPKKIPTILKFFYTLFRDFSTLLLFGAALCLLNILLLYMVDGNFQMDNVILAGLLIVIIFVNGSFKFFHERKSQEIIASFAAILPPKATVIRGGEIMTINSKDVVVGDLIDIKVGDRVPADIRLINCQNLWVDNSPLTGESESVKRSLDSTDVNFLESKNITFCSTSILEGTGRGQTQLGYCAGLQACTSRINELYNCYKIAVPFIGFTHCTYIIYIGIAVRCGDNTAIGNIAGLTSVLKPNTTLMSKELKNFIKIINSWTFFLGITLGTIALSLNYSIIEAFVFIIVIIVANVPEGLLATITVCLTISARRMRSKNCLVKSLDSVETLGSTSVICSDKTGTLTQNRMTVYHIWLNCEVIKAGTSPSQQQFYNNTPEFEVLARCAILCNRAEFLPDQQKRPIISRLVRGEAFEAAILKFVENTIGSTIKYRALYPKLIEIPFSSVTKYQCSVHAFEGNRCLLVMKGAPENIVERCNKIFYKNKTLEMNQNYRNMCNTACDELAQKGERVLGFCDLVLSRKYTTKYNYTTEPLNFPQRGLRFVGFMSLYDPPRPQVPEAVRKCKVAGIKIAMVTGDHPITATAVAKQIGVITKDDIIEAGNISVIDSSLSSPENKAIVICGSTLKEMSSKNLDEILYNYSEIVFARTSPIQKLQIVESYQRLGEIVAATGDGINDALALKKANVGIAMGIVGTQISQESADIILLDDNFASIITGIEEGRRIFDNLKRSITYTLASNVPEIIPIFTFVLLNIPLPLGVTGILCIDLLTDMLPAISLAFEKAEYDIMLRRPRNPRKDKLVSRKLYFLAYGHIGLMETLGGFIVYFVVMAEHGFMPERLIGIREEWNTESINNLKDSYGQEWTYKERKVLEYTCHSAFMVSVVVTQWATLIVCRTRLNSVFELGMENMVLNISLLAETGLACFLTATPYMRYLKFYSVQFHWWLCALPFAILILIFEEFRKWHIRQYPKGWYQRETYY